MKKLSMIAAACAVMFAMVSCSSPADKAVEFAEDAAAAVAAGDYEKVEQLAKEEAEWRATLSPEEIKEADEAVAEWAAKQIGNALQGIEF